MDASTAAQRTAAAVSTVGSHFMLDGATYKRGAELGFQGLDFYVTGRGGVLGEVDADVVAAGFAFFEPGAVRTLWEQGRSVMPAVEAASEFAACCSAWAEAHVPDEPKAAAVHQLNVLRELRNGLHAAAVISAGLSPLEALSIKTPQMVPLFGWSEAGAVDGLQERWDAAEAQTDRSITHAYEGLDDAGRAELAELANALHHATKG